MQKQTAYILGNGISRQNFKLNELKTSKFGVGPIFGCNGIYRDHPEEIDYLIAIDNKIQLEIINSNFNKNKFISVPIEEQYEPYEYSPTHYRNNAGMVAMKEAIKMGYETLICLGMDFIIEDKILNVGNIYEGTNCYGVDTKASYYDTVNRCHYLNWFIKKYNFVNYIFVFDKNYKFRLNPSDNLKYVIW